MSTALTYERGPSDGPAAALPPAQIIRTLIRRRWLLVACGICGGIVGLIASMLMTPTFTASGNLIVDSKSFAIPQLQGAVSGEASPDPLPAVRTAALDLRSPALLQQVVSELHLNTYSYFNAGLRPPTLLSQASEAFHQLMARFIGQPSSAPADDVAMAALELDHRMTVFYDNTSLLIRLSVILPDSKLASTIVNTIFHLYIANAGEARAQENSAANVSIRGSVQRVQDELNALEDKAGKLRASNELTVLPAGSLGQQLLSDLGTAQAHAVSDRQRLEAKLQKANDLKKNGNLAAFADIIASPTISRLREQEALAGQRLARISATTLSSSPMQRVAKAEYDQVKSQIANEISRVLISLDAEVQAAREHEAAATQAMQRASGAAAKASLIQADIAQIEEEIKDRRKLYMSLTERAMQTELSPEVARHAPGVHVGSPAVIPVVPSGPHTKVVASLGMFAGLLIGSVGALRRGSGNPTLRDPEEIAAYARLPLFGVVPTRTGRLRSASQTTGRPPWTFEQKEALGLLYARLRHQAAQRGKELRSVLFASNDDDEAEWLARSFGNIAAAEGERVLFINVRARPDSVGRSGEPTNRLGALLDGRQAWPNAIIKDDGSGTSRLVMEADSLDETHSRTIRRLQNVLHEVAMDYTMVVLATHGGVRSVEASHLVRASDFTILVVNTHRARPSSVVSSSDYLASIKNDLALAVLDRRAS